MDLFKNLLFLHGHFVDPRMDDGVPEAPAPVAPDADQERCRARNDAG